MKFHGKAPMMRRRQTCVVVVGGWLVVCGSTMYWGTGKVGEMPFRHFFELAAVVEATRERIYIYIDMY